MGFCCSTERRKPKILDSKSFMTLISETTAILDNCINSIMVHIKRFETLDALGIFLNGIYSYLLKIQIVLLEKEPQGEHDDDALHILKEALVKFQADLEEKDFLTNRDAMKVTQNKILNIELAFKSLILQLEKVSPLEDHIYLQGDFQKGFDYILGKNMVSPDFLEKEIKEIIAEHEYKEKQLKCSKCLSIMKYFNNFQELAPEAPVEETLICNTCNQIFLSSSGFFRCQPCNSSVCKICDSQGCLVKCEKCKCELKFTNNLEGLKAYNSSLFLCDICGGQLKWTEGVNHCFTEGDNYDICFGCRSKMYVKHQVHVIIESQRWWKNQWTECPLLPKERGKYVNENGENAGFELEDSDEDFQWVEDWQLKQKEGSDGWEYSLAWGNPFSNNAEGSFVRRKVHIKKREKIMKG